MSEIITYVAAMRKFFGLLPGETLTQFGDELKSLNEADKVELTKLLKTVGFSVIERRIG